MTAANSGVPSTSPSPSSAFAPPASGFSHDAFAGWHTTLLSCAGTYCSHGTRRTSDSAMLEREMSPSRGGRACKAVGGGQVEVSGKERKVAGSGPVKGAMMQSARKVSTGGEEEREDALGLKP